MEEQGADQFRHTTKVCPVTSGHTCWQFSMHSLPNIHAVYLPPHQVCYCSQHVLQHLALTLARITFACVTLVRITSQHLHASHLCASHHSSCSLYALLVSWLCSLWRDHYLPFSCVWLQRWAACCCRQLCFCWQRLNR